MPTEDFDKVWKELTPIQKESAQWDDGAMLVLAGPGSGKTRVLTCRIARILDKTQDKNFRILALTFTNKAADEMRERVEKYVPTQGNRLFIGTLHSFCADILRQHGTHLQINPNFTIYSQQDDLQALLNDAVEKIRDKSKLIIELDKKLLPVIHRLKSFLVLPEQSGKKFKDKQFGERVALVYGAYEKELNERNALDFPSLILQAHRLFTKYPAFAKRYRTVYPYICIDEFQDTNHAQYNLYRAITGDSYKNVFVVADDDQIIYQWNGASHNRIRDFINDFSPEIIQLPDNFRCPPKIVALANNLIRHNHLRTPDKKPLKAFRSDTGNKNTVCLMPVFPDFETEAYEIAKSIKTLHSDHLSTVAVLGRSRKLLEIAEKKLKDEKIPAVLSQRKDEFESTPFVWLHSVLRLAANNQNRSYLETVCGSFAQLTQISIDPEDVIAIFQEKNIGYLHHWFHLVKQKTGNGAFSKILGDISEYLIVKRDFQVFNRVALDWFSDLTNNNQEPGTDPLTETFAGYKDERTVWEELYRSILRNTGENISLETFLQELQMHSKEPVAKPDTVRLMTIHAAKGKEFEHVYLIGLVEDEMPSFQSKKKGDDSPQMEEERRNCYVAITRAEKTLTLSYAEKYRGWSKNPSRFLYEMKLL